MIKNNIKRYIKGFSLAEILLSVTIIAIILLLAMPVITKKSIDNLLNKESASAEFYYNETTNDNSELPCYITTVNGITTTIQDNTGSCEKHSFTIPNNVHKVDITLVAGGGGGGGAAGGLVQEKTLNSSDSDFQFNKTRLKKAKINILTGKGSEGDGKDSSGVDIASSPRKGGNSGTAIIDFQIPNEFVTNNSKINFINSNYNDTSSNDLERITVSFNTASAPFGITDSGMGLKFTGRKEFGDTIDYTSLFFVTDAVTNEFLRDQTEENVKASDYSKVICGLNETSEIETAQTASFTGKNIVNSSIVSTLCKLNPASYKASVDGELPLGLPDSTTTITSGKLSPGGKGGSNGTRYSDKGIGGDGASLVYLCYNGDGTGSTSNECQWTNSLNTSSIAETNPAGERYGEVTITVEHPGGAGAGGAGGSAVRINNFVVRPGKTYTIVVGKGGNGGLKGNTSKNPTSGSNGRGGSSTAIYDEENALVLMVIGGVGGIGGNVIDNDNNPSFTRVPSIPTSSRNVPMVIIGSKYVSSLNFDSNIAEAVDIATTDNTDIDETNALAGAVSKRLVYSYMKNMVQPLFTLTSGIARAVSETSNNFDTYDKKTGGFSQYTSSTFSNATYLNRVFLSGQAKYKGNNDTNIYAGFFFRYPILNSYFYPGGLGGFSGLGGKAGCGGGFVGNYYGNKYSDATEGYLLSVNENYANTISLMKNENGADTVKVYNVNQYIEGCKPTTVDGHTPHFVSPVISNGNIESYGQAGSGGGGGGYNINLGSGNGAEGQNGYVVISWKK